MYIEALELRITWNVSPDNRAILETFNTKSNLKGERSSTRWKYIMNSGEGGGAEEQSLQLWLLLPESLIRTCMWTFGPYLMHQPVETTCCSCSIDTLRWNLGHHTVATSQKAGVRVIIPILPPSEMDNWLLCQPIYSQPLSSLWRTQ